MYENELYGYLFLTFITIQYNTNFVEICYRHIGQYYHGYEALFKL